MSRWPNQNEVKDLGVSQRRDLILETLKRTQIVQVSELSKLFGISMVSVRRDLEILENKGLLKRIHGGAVEVKAPGVSEILKIKTEDNLIIKEKIGKVAAKLIEPSESIIIDSGTTPLQVARNISYDLLNHGNLSVVSNSLPILHTLGPEKGVHFVFLGGIYLSNYDVVVGPRTVDQVKTMHADKLFLGTDGITFSQGITTANQLEAEVSQAMASASSEVIVVSDSSKIGKKGLETIVPITRIDKLITDIHAPRDFVEKIRDQGVEVILVSEN